LFGHVSDTGTALRGIKFRKEIKAMARANGFILDTGASFPRIEFTTVSGEQVVLPRDVKGRWTVLLFYRGDW
jgi:hypothetical protein